MTKPLKRVVFLAAVATSISAQASVRAKGPAERSVESPAEEQPSILNRFNAPSARGFELALKRSGWAPTAKAEEVKAVAEYGSALHMVPLDKRTVDDVIAIVRAQYPGDQVWLGDMTGKGLPDVTNAGDLRIGIRFQNRGNYRGRANLIAHLDSNDQTPTFSLSKEDPETWAIVEREKGETQAQWLRARPPTLVERVRGWFSR